MLHDLATTVLLINCAIYARLLGEPGWPYVWAALAACQAVEIAIKAAA